MTDSTDSEPGASSASARTLPFWLPPLFYLLLSALFLWRSTFAGDVFLPAALLRHFAPWSGQNASTDLPLWNPLRWDGIGQFYPWRHFAGETIRQGIVPLWNPYQFCGTPFVANSQSAVFYPGNLLFYLLPTARAFGLTALLHLTCCGWFTYLFLRRIGCAALPALLGGVVYAFSTWQVSWLQLPTFLATSCWFPLLLRQVYAVAKGAEGEHHAKAQRRKEEQGEGYSSNRDYSRPLTAVSLALVIGTMLLAGHLQIAFYGLLVGGLWAIALGIGGARTTGVRAMRPVFGAYVLALALGGMLALPQILPALELSRGSHRQGSPTAAGYGAYVELALPTAQLAQATLPSLFGGDQNPDNPFWGFYTKDLGGGQQVAIRHNQAETAVYVGIAPLLLTLFAVVRGVRRGQMDRPIVFFGLLALLALLLALGTGLNRLLYFGVPGFAQSGSPARVLVLWALAAAILSALALDRLLKQPPTRREIALTLGAFVFVWAAGLSLTNAAVSTRLPGFDLLHVPTLGEAFGRIGGDWVRLGVLLAAGTGLLFAILGRSRTAASWGLVALVVLDLFAVGMNANPTARPEAVYPETPGIAFLRDHLGNERMMPLNRTWSLYSAPPAVLPPNAGMVYKLRDVQGYDSLLTRQYKEWANEFALPNRMGVKDASPLEVGNMVFFQNPNDARIAQLGVSTLVSLAPSSPQFRPESAPNSTPLSSGDEAMALYAVPNALPRARLVSGQGDATFREDGPTRVVLEVQASADDTLILADQWFPGWEAWVDGRAAAIQHAPDAPIYRAVNVPSGTHGVAFTYNPASFRVGLYCACFALLLLVLLTAYTRIAVNKTE